MGSFFVGYFLRRGWKVMGFDTKKANGLPAGVEFAGSNARAVQDADFVLMAVPMAETAKVAREVSSFMKRGSPLVEITSVKGSGLSELRKYLKSEKVPLLSLHPLFGPLAKMKGAKICVIGSQQDLSTARRLFPEARLIRMGAKAHDRLMAYTLSLVHLTNLAIVSTLVKGIGAVRLKRVAPPRGSAQMNLGKAVLSQDKSLIAHIQTDNPFVGEVLSSVIAELESLRKLISGNDAAGFERRFADLAGKFARAELNRALERTYLTSDV